MDIRDQRKQAKRQIRVQKQRRSAYMDHRLSDDEVLLNKVSFAELEADYAVPPVNKYSKGPFNNFFQVLFPLSLRTANRIPAASVPPFSQDTQQAYQEMAKYAHMPPDFYHRPLFRISDQLSIIERKRKREQLLKQKEARSADAAKPSNLEQ